MLSGFPSGSDGKESTYNMGGLDREFPLEKGMTTHYFCLEHPMTEDPGGLQSMGSQRVGHN